jgi:CHAT domain-containing protein
LDPPPAPLPLRILVVIAAPDDQKSLATEEENGLIQAALDEAVRDHRVQVAYLDDATLPAIGEALRRFQPHVLHYTGHGSYDAEKERSYLALEDDSGRTKNAGIKELRPHLKDAKGLRLVLLSGCQTARTSDVDAFSGVATGLLQEDIPAVLAMQYSILDQSGIELAEAFYAALAQGEAPAQAIQRARLALWQFDEGPGYDWGVPALYLRAQGMRLLTPPRLRKSGETSEVYWTWAACPCRPTLWGASRNCGGCAAPCGTATATPFSCAASAAWARAAWRPSCCSAPARK